MLAALQPRGHMNDLECYENYLKCYIGMRKRYVVCGCMYAHTHTVHTDKFSIEHTSVGLTHGRPIIIMAVYTNIGVLGHVPQIDKFFVLPYIGAYDKRN